MRLCKLGATRAVELVIFQRNLFFDVKNSRISLKTFRRFVEYIRSLSDADQFGLRGKIHDHIERNSHNLCFQGKKLAHSPLPTDQFCRVMNGVDLLAYNSVDPAGRRPAYDFASDDSVSDYLSVLEDDRDTSVQLNNSSTLTSGLGIVWLTKSEAISRYMTGAAERLRDVLGLTHYNENQLLVVVTLPASSVPEIRNPTALDAGVNWIFRSKGSRASWGRTVDLDTSGGGGLPEAVSGPIPIKSSFTVEKTVRLVSSFRQEKYDELAKEAALYMDSVYEADCPIAKVAP